MKRLHEEPQWRKFFTFDRCGFCDAEIAYVESDEGGEIAVDLEAFPVTARIGSISAPPYSYIPHGLICAGRRQ